MFEQTQTYENQSKINASSDIKIIWGNKDSLKLLKMVLAFKIGFLNFTFTPHTIAITRFSQKKKNLKVVHTACMI